jgi:hypothetical protein
MASQMVYVRAALNKKQNKSGAREKKQREKRQENRAFPLCFFVTAFE